MDRSVRHWMLTLLVTREIISFMLNSVHCLCISYTQWHHVLEFIRKVYQIWY